MYYRYGLNVPPSERRPVAWFSPKVLLRAAVRLAHSKDFLIHLDRRESFKDKELQPIDLADRKEPFWLDFISDTGDGGNSTFAVALAALHGKLRVRDARGGEAELPEGDLLVLGGDLAYPGSDREDYQFRFIEMFERASKRSRFAPVQSDQMKQALDPSNKVVVAIPQNHDWFVSASTFCRFFVDYDKGAVFGARTPQRQTYFAAKLPNRWWVLGFDWALLGDIDRIQYEAFTDLLERKDGTGLQAGDNLVLVYPEPYWVRRLGDDAPQGYPYRYQRLEALLLDHGTFIRVRLAGDLHHYVHEKTDYGGRDTHLITCGNGGAFLHPTHTREVRAPKAIIKHECPATAQDPTVHSSVHVGLCDGKGCVSPGAEQFVRFERDDEQGCYPTPKQSRSLAWRGWASLFRPHLSQPARDLGLSRLRAELFDSNVAFALIVAGLYGLTAAFTMAEIFDSSGRVGMAVLEQLSLSQAAGAWMQTLPLAPWALLLHLAILGAGVGAMTGDTIPSWAKVIIGGFHGALHILLLIVLCWLGARLIVPWCTGALCVRTWPLVAVVIAGGVLGTALFGACLTVMCAGFNLLANNAFSAIANPHYKGFLRMRIDPEGLHVYALGIDTVEPTTTPYDEARPDTPSARWRIVERFTLRH